MKINIKFKALGIILGVLLMIGVANADWWDDLFALFGYNSSSGESSGGNSSTWQIEGDVVYIDIPNRGRITQQPHTLNDLTNNPIINFTSYFASEQCLDFAFGFDTDEARPTYVELYNPHYYNVTKSYTCNQTNTTFNYTLSPKHAWCWQERDTYNCTGEYYENCTVNGTETILLFEHDFETGNLGEATIYWNETYFNEYDKIPNNRFNIIDYTDNEEVPAKVRKKWYRIDNITFQPNETKTIRPEINVKPKLGENSGKYDILIKRCQDTIHEAYDSGNYVLIDPWWNSSWTYARKITFDKWTGPLTENLTNFPILVVIDDTIIDYSDKAKPDGTDLRFIDDDNSTELDYHIELWNTSGDSFVWVQVPLLENSSTDHIWMYYNYSAASDAQDEAGTYDADFVGVWHLKEAVGGSGAILDSTQYDNDGTDSGSPSLGVLGKIGNATDFDGDDDYVNLNYSADFTVFTLALWFNTTADVNNEVFLGAIAEGGANDPSIRIQYVAGGDEVGFFVKDDEGDAIFISPAVDINDGVWHHVVCTLASGGVGTVFIDSLLAGTSTNADIGTTSLSGIPFFIGANNNKGGIQLPIDAAIDDVRISNVTRTTAWINASYLTMTEAFSTFGGEVLGADTTAPTFSSPATNTTIADTPCNFTMTLTDETALSGYYFETNNTGTLANSSFISVSGASITGWNVSTLNSTVGTVVQWKYYTNDSSDNWNASAAQTVTTTTADTCTCTGIDTNWEIDMSDYCNIVDDCDLGVGNLTFTGSGNCTCDAKIELYDMGDPGNGNILWGNDECLILTR